MVGQWVELETRITVLESYFHTYFSKDDPDDSIYTQINKLQKLLLAYTPLNKLIDVLTVCDVDYKYADTSSIEIEHAREYLLATYDLMSAAVDKIEILINYMSEFQKIKQCLTTLNSNDSLDKSNILAKYKYIEQKFQRLVSRLIVILEQRAILKYKQNALMVSIESIRDL